MSRLRMLTVITLMVWIVPSATARAGGSWRWPVAGPVVERFRLGPDPFARGQHRGIDIGARAGKPVLAPCGGHVSFAGPVGRAGRTVSLACGPYIVSEQGLAAIGIRSGTTVTAGTVVGTAGDRAVHVGVRIATRRFGYVDPLLLLRRTGARSPVPGPLPIGRTPRLGRPPRAGPAPRPGAPSRPAPVALVRRPAPAGEPGVAGVPVLAWIGFGLVTLAAPAAAMARSRRRAGARRRAQAASKRLASPVR